MHIFISSNRFISVVSLFFLSTILNLSSNKCYGQNLVNWVGGTSSDYFTKSNWSDPTIDFTNIGAVTLVVGVGVPNNCSHAGGSSAITYRPSKFNTLTGSSFTIRGLLYPNNNDSLNGNITLNTGADLNIRNIAYIGRNSSAVITHNGGNLTTKYAFNIAIGTSGSNVTYDLAGGNIYAGTDLNVANGTGLTAIINIIGGTVNISGNLNIGINGRIYISGVGVLKMTGNKVAQLNGLITDGRLFCTTGKTLSIVYDGINTTASIPQNPNRMITEYPDSVVLRTTNIVCTIEKKSGNILSYRFKGVEFKDNLGRELPYQTKA